MDISIIIPTYERTEWLLDCLDALNRQEGMSGRFEVIVVDDGTKDHEGKKKIVTSRTWSFPLSYLQQFRKGPAAARNLGIFKARGEIIAFTDDDAIPDSHWLLNLIEPLGPKAIGGVAGVTLPYRVKTLTERYLSHVQHLSLHHVGINQELVYIITVNAAFPKAVLKEVGGFDEAFPFPSGEDMDLGFRIRRLGYRFVQAEGARVIHRNRESLTRMWRTWFIYGRGAYMAASKNAANVDTGGVTSAKAVETTKVFRVIWEAARRIFGNMSDPTVRGLDAVWFPLLELTNHVTYQLGRLREMVAGSKCFNRRG